MTDRADWSPAQVQAYDSARATEMKKHTYTSTPARISTCACGLEVPTPDVAIHIEEKAEAAGVRAALDAA